MENINKNRFDLLLKQVHDCPWGRYELFDNNGNSVRAFYDTDYESDNGLEEDEEEFEEFQCIVFRRIEDNALFEVNYHQIPIKAICNEQIIY